MSPVSLVNLQDHMIKQSCEFMDESPSSKSPNSHVWWSHALRSGDMLLVCHVILQCHVIRGPRDFIDAKPSWQVTTLPSLMARGIAVVEMKRNIPHALP